MLIIETNSAIDEIIIGVNLAPLESCFLIKNNYNL